VREPNGLLRQKTSEQSVATIDLFLLGSVNMTERKAKVKLIQGGTYRLLSNGYREFRRVFLDIIIRHAASNVETIAGPIRLSEGSRP
jgi:hypothetical protein